MNKKPQPTFLEFLQKKADSILTRSDEGEKARARLSVQMVRRHRADTLSDRFGTFSNMGTNDWLDDKLSPRAAEEMEAMHFLPILRRAVTANTAAMITGQVEVTAEKAVKDPAASGVASVAKGVVSFMEGRRDFWNSRVETQLAGLSQLGYGCFVRVRFNPHKKGETITEQIHDFEDMPMPGKFSCECGAGGDFFDEPVEEGEGGLGIIQCPECQGVAGVTEMPSAAPIMIEAGTREKNSGELEMTVHPHFEHRVDDRETANGYLDGAKWHEHHHLVDRATLEMQNPYDDLGNPEPWSFPLQWLHALKTGSAEHIQNWQDSIDIFEVREISLLPEEYASHVEPQGGGFVLKGEDGEPMMRFDEESGEEVEVFRLSPGERPIDKFPHGFRFRMHGKKFLSGTPDDPGFAGVDFREEWTYIGFTPDPHAFWCTPLLELLTLNDDMTTLYTIDIKSRERNSKTNIVADGLLFDPDAFDYEISFTNAGALEPNDDIKRHFAVIDAPEMRTALEGLMYLFEFAPQIGAPPPVALGAPDNSDETYGGQRLKHQRSMMLLAPYSLSKAEGKVNVFRQLIRGAQKHWPAARFRYLSTRLGIEWKEQDIDAFREAELERVLKLSFVEGSEQPTTLIEREQKLGAILHQLVEAIPAIAQAREFMPDLRNLFSKYLELAGIDFDFGDEDAEQRLAESRLDKIKQALASSETPDDMLVEMSLPALQPLPRENHETQIEYWTDQIRATLAEPEPNYTLVAAFDEMIARHEAAALGLATQQNADMLAVEQPIRDAEAAATAAAGDAEAAKEASARQAEDVRIQEQRAAETKNQADTQKHQLAMKAAELVAQQKLAAMKAQPQARA